MRPAEPLHPHEWNFDKVPDSELVACCWWEYARESALMRKTIDHHNYARTDVPLKVVKRLSSIGPAWLTGVGSPLRMFLGVMCPSAGFPRPWQSLSRVEKRNLVKELEEQPEPVRSVRDIYEAVNTARALLNEAEARQTTYEEKLFKNRILPSIPNRLSVMWLDGKSAVGVESVILDIGWRWHTNRQLVTAFERWLLDNRPKTAPEPKEKKAGHKRIDWRKKLRDLGVMRLLNNSTVAGMNTRCPEAARYFGNWEGKHWSAARKRGIENFRSLFPFGELPEHAHTKGGKGKL